MNIDIGRQDKASLCRVSLEKIYHEAVEESIPVGLQKKLKSESTILVYYVIFKFKVVSDTGTTNTVLIRIQPDYDLKVFMNSEIQIYCSCVDFMYRACWILNQRNSLVRSTEIDAKISKAISNAPLKKTATTLLCKHSYAALIYLVNNYSKLMSLV